MLLIWCHGGGAGSRAGGRNGKVSSIVPHHIRKKREREKKNTTKISHEQSIVDNMKICEWQQLIRLKFCEWYLTSNFYFVRDAGPSLSLPWDIISN